MPGESKLHVLLLPGLGATERMYDPLVEALERHFGAGRCVYTQVAYPEPLPQETMAQFANRLWQETGTRRRRFDFAVGTSFGGMLVQELVSAGLIEPRRMILISPAFTGGDISRMARALARLADLVPRSLHATVRDHLAWIWPLLRVRNRYARELAGMIRSLPPGLLFRAARMIRTWRNPPRDLVRTVSRGLVPGTLLVMGGRDPIISPRRVARTRRPDLYFAHGDHFIALTCADEIAAAMRALQGGTPVL